METKDLYHWVALSMAPGVGSVLFKRLTEAFGSPEGVFHATAKDLERVEGIGPKVISCLKRFGWKAQVAKELRGLEKAGARLVTWNEEEYPRSLKEIYDPPPLLYVRGSLTPEDQKAVAVVGSRYPTTYGQMYAQRIAMGLSRRGVTVVSGLARGVDSAAHGAALTAGGRTVGVLGCGIDVIYPPENGRLLEAVASCGAVISEFPLGTPPDSDHFPIRNRIISGMSLGVVVVEATLRSGSLITARFALEHGREVFAVPGNADSARSAGTNRLIRQGAKLVTGHRGYPGGDSPACGNRDRSPGAPADGGRNYRVLGAGPESHAYRWGHRLNQPPERAGFGRPSLPGACRPHPAAARDALHKS